MSIEKNRKEALRWLKTAEDDLDVAIILEKNSKFPQACCYSQQAGEKAIKAKDIPHCDGQQEKQPLYFPNFNMAFTYAIQELIREICL